MKPAALLVISCHAHRASRQQAVLDTWLANPPAALLPYLVEGGQRQEFCQPGRIGLAVPDDYAHLADKTFAAVRLLRARHPDIAGILKCDDDTYLDCQRAVAAIGAFDDYHGCPAADQKHFTPYARGGCYWLSRRATEALTAKPLQAWSDAPWFHGHGRMRKRGERSYREGISIEDAMVGDILHQAGIQLTPDSRFVDGPRPCLYSNPTQLCNHYVTTAWMHQLQRFSQLSPTPLNRWRIRIISAAIAPRRPR